MNKYRIAIVDEFLPDIEKFQRYVHKNDTEQKFNVLAFEPLTNKEELVSDLLNSNLDAIISDYRLNEYNATIPYDGVDLVNEVLSRKHGFPCFVLTSFDDDAVKDSDDVNIVYFKGLMTSTTDEKFTFIQRIENQIQKYQTKIREFTEELNALIAVKSQRNLNPVEEDRYVELSHILDKSVVGENSIPRSFYSIDTNNRLDSLIQRTDELLARLKGGDQGRSAADNDENN